MSNLGVSPMPMTKTQKQQELEWQTEEDVRTLQRAGEIKADKKRFDRAMIMAGKQMKALKSMSRSNGR